MSLPDDTRRLFPHTDLADLEDDSHRAFVIERLLEEGESGDLAWLVTSASEEELAAWLVARGGRRLSHRSRAFWEILLGVDAGEPAEGAHELWRL